MEGSLKQLFKFNAAQFLAVVRGEGPMPPIQNPPPLLRWLDTPLPGDITAPESEPKQPDISSFLPYAPKPTIRSDLTQMSNSVAASPALYPPATPITPVHVDSRKRSIETANSTPAFPLNSTIQHSSVASSAIYESGAADSPALLLDVRSKLKDCVGLVFGIMFTQESGSNMYWNRAAKGKPSDADIALCGVLIGLPGRVDGVLVTIPLVASSCKAISLPQCWNLLLDVLIANVPKVCFHAVEVLVRLAKQCDRDVPDLSKRFDSVLQSVSMLVDPHVASWMLNPSAENADDFVGVMQLEMTICAEQLFPGSMRSLFEQHMKMCNDLARSTLRKIQEADMTRAFLQVEMKLSPILARMSLVGVQFDDMVIRKNEAELHNAIVALEKVAYSHAGREFLLTSPQQVSQVLFKDLALPVPAIESRYKKRKAHTSTSEAVLTALLDKHPIISVLLRHRKLSKLKSTWVEALVGHSRRGADGIVRIHTTWSQTNTVTGRLASLNPNLQNLPVGEISISSDSPASIVIRNSFVAAPGCVLLSADYSQIEVRVLAHFCGGESAMAKMLATGGDIHRLIASWWLNKEAIQVTYKEREQAKRVCYGIIYGAGPGKLAELLNISFSEAGHLMTSFLRRFLHIKELFEKVDATIRSERGYIVTLGNRRRSFPSSNFDTPAKASYAQRQAYSQLIQGSASDIIKLAMLKIQEVTRCRVLRSRLLLQIHDELLFEVPKDELEIMLKVVRDSMETVLPQLLAVPIPVSLHVGERWGSMREASVA
eukprot:TRINITY_DN14239_c0_g1_i1.p1 TRINITY_DN14239_c0_g1~~TRINITY_DN14239_c0_g1_i1.p1  ORF type:complete len:770 (-),score=106.29 TRINITY_DN14239_c0_g1_i1:4-2313(-)